jgi:hypothetical protein
MAVKEINVNHDFRKVGIIKDVRFNPLTTTQKVALAATLGPTNVGLGVYDTDLKDFQLWDGTVFLSTVPQQSGLVPKGNVAHNATEPSAPTIGDLYVFNSVGVNTWESSVPVQVGDQVYWDGTHWQYIQGNVVDATETVPGVAELATQTETNTGVDDQRIVTPLKLNSFLSSRASPKTYFATGLALTADIPLVINHNLALQNRDAFVLSFKVSNSEANVDVDSIGINSCTVTSNVAVTGGVVTIIGF